MVLDSSKRKRVAERQCDLYWNRSKPADISDLKQRRSQIEKYINQNPNHKGRDVLAQTRKQQPDPQPDADVRSLNRLIKRIEIKQEAKKPAEYPNFKTHQFQIKRYLDKYPEAKGNTMYQNGKASQVLRGILLS